MADQSEQIQMNALAPQSATVDGATVQQQPVAAQILSDTYAAAAASLKKRRRGLRFSKLIPPGPVSDDGGTERRSGGCLGF